MTQEDTMNLILDTFVTYGFKIMSILVPLLGIWLGYYIFKFGWKMIQKSTGSGYYYIGKKGMKRYNNQEHGEALYKTQQDRYRI